MDAKNMLRQLDIAMNQLRLLRELITEGDVRLPPSIASEAEQGLCHKCKDPIKGERPVRGCHRNCAQEMTRAIKAGETTELELMEAGLYGPVAVPGRKKKTHFRELIEGAQVRLIEHTDGQKSASRKQMKIDDSK